MLTATANLPGTYIENSSKSLLCAHVRWSSVCTYLQNQKSGNFVYFIFDGRSSQNSIIYMPSEFDKFKWKSSISFNMKLKKRRSRAFRCYENVFERAGTGASCAQLLQNWFNKHKKNTYNWTIIANVAVPFLWVHFHCVNGHGFSVLDANFERFFCRMLSHSAHKHKNTETVYFFVPNRLVMINQRSFVVAKLNCYGIVSLKEITPVISPSPTCAPTIYGQFNWASEMKNIVRKYSCFLVLFMLCRLGNSTWGTYTRRWRNEHY